MLFLYSIYNILTNYVNIHTFPSQSLCKITLYRITIRLLYLHIQWGRIIIKYIEEIDIIQRINFQREVLELKLKSNKGIITKEIIKISESLDALIVNYYQQN